MNATRKVKLKELTPNLTCHLCKGYFIDASTIIECLHSFCRPCIVKHLEKSEFCPVCDVQLHSTLPLSSVRSDHMLQEIVYKLVPGLFQDEMLRRRQFYTYNPLSLAINQRDSGRVYSESYITSDDKIQLSLEFCTGNLDLRKQTRRYYQCPAAVSISILKKLILSKFDLNGTTHRINIMYRERVLPDDFLLMDIAYKYSWTQNGKSPLRLSYAVQGGIAAGIIISNTSENKVKINGLNGIQNVTKLKRKRLSIIKSDQENNTNDIMKTKLNGITEEDNKKSKIQSTVLPNTIQNGNDPPEMKVKKNMKKKNVIKNQKQFNSLDTGTDCLIKSEIFSTTTGCHGDCGLEGIKPPLKLTKHIPVDLTTASSINSEVQLCISEMGVISAKSWGEGGSKEIIISVPTVTTKTKMTQLNGNYINNDVSRSPIELLLNSCTKPEDKLKTNEKSTLKRKKKSNSKVSSLPTKVKKVKLNTESLSNQSLKKLEKCVKKKSDRTRPRVKKIKLNSVVMDTSMAVMSSSNCKQTIDSTNDSIQLPVLTHISGQSILKNGHSPPHYNQEIHSSGLTHYLTSGPVLQASNPFQLISGIKGEEIKVNSKSAYLKLNGNDDVTKATLNSQTTPTTTISNGKSLKKCAKFIKSKSKNESAAVNSETAPIINNSTVDNKNVGPSYHGFKTPTKKNYLEDIRGQQRTPTRTPTTPTTPTTPLQISPNGILIKNPIDLFESISMNGPSSGLTFQPNNRFDISTIGNIGFNIGCQLSSVSEAKAQASAAQASAAQSHAQASAAQSHAQASAAHSHAQASAAQSQTPTPLNPYVTTNYSTIQPSFYNNPRLISTNPMVTTNIFNNNPSYSFHSIPFPYPTNVSLNSINPTLDLSIKKSSGINYINISPKKSAGYEIPIQNDKLNLNLNSMICSDVNNSHGTLLRTSRQKSKPIKTKSIKQMRLLPLIEKIKESKLKSGIIQENGNNNNVGEVQVGLRDGAAAVDAADSDMVGIDIGLKDIGLDELDENITVVEGDKGQTVKNVPNSLYVKLPEIISKCTEMIVSQTNSITISSNGDNMINTCTDDSDNNTINFLKKNNNYQ